MSTIHQEANDVAVDIHNEVVGEDVQSSLRTKCAMELYERYTSMSSARFAGADMDCLVLACYIVSTQSGLGFRGTHSDARLSHEFSRLRCSKREVNEYVRDIVRTVGTENCKYVIESNMVHKLRGRETDLRPLHRRARIALGLPKHGLTASDRHRIRRYVEDEYLPNCGYAGPRGSTGYDECMERHGLYGAAP